MIIAGTGRQQQQHSHRIPKPLPLQTVQTQVSNSRAPRQIITIICTVPNNCTRNAPTMRPPPTHKPAQLGEIAYSFSDSWSSLVEQDRAASCLFHPVVSRRRVFRRYCGTKTDERGRSVSEFGQVKFFDLLADDDDLDWSSPGSHLLVRAFIFYSSRPW